MRIIRILLTALESVFSTRASLAVDDRLINQLKSEKKRINFEKCERFIKFRSYLIGGTRDRLRVYWKADSEVYWKSQRMSGMIKSDALDAVHLKLDSFFNPLGAIQYMHPH